MSGILEILNRQRFRGVRTDQLREVMEWVLGADAEIREWELGVHLIASRAMAAMHVRWMDVQGSTDILTFDHGSGAGRIHGELFISVEDAVRQAAEFGTDAGSELARYAVHGVLHLQGYDDLQPSMRKVMKARENAWMRRLARRFDLRQLVGAPRKAPPRRRPKRHG